MIYLLDDFWNFPTVAAADFKKISFCHLALDTSDMGHDGGRLASFLSVNSTSRFRFWVRHIGLSLSPVNSLTRVRFWLWHTGLFLASQFYVEGLILTLIRSFVIELPLPIDVESSQIVGSDYITIPTNSVTTSMISQNVNPLHSFKLFELNISLRYSHKHNWEAFTFVVKCCLMAHWIPFIGRVSGWSTLVKYVHSNITDVCT